MRISDWSSDVCSSDLHTRNAQSHEIVDALIDVLGELLAGHEGDDDDRETCESRRYELGADRAVGEQRCSGQCPRKGDRKRVVQGKSVSVRVVLGGRRILKNKNNI